MMHKTQPLKVYFKMIDWTTILIAVVGSISIGELISLFTAREQKKGMQIDNKQKEDERYLALINELQDQNSALTERLDKKDARIIELEDRCADLRNKLDEANTSLAKATLLKCSRLSCVDRKPPLGYTELTPEEVMAERSAGNIE